jgi:DNA polymerase (family 10)
MTITNQEIARIIEEIGEMLEIIGNEKDQFRIIAYQNAARKIELISEQIADIYDKSGFAGLLEIKGIGESIAKKIEEIIKTGKCKYHDELAKKVPSAIIKFLAIPGVGPHLAANIYKNYKVDSINKLKKAILADKSEKIFKTKTKNNILEGIDQLESISSRMLLSFAEPIAEEAVGYLKNMEEVNNADYVGSLRRMKETIGDIDLIASLSDKTENVKAKLSTKVIDQFTKLPFVIRVISAGDTKASILHRKGVQVDLEILPSDEYGSLLQHFTGSKEHNVALRTWAEKHDFSISEHGIKFIKSKVNKVIKCNTEEKVYKTLGMDWIPPELRENNGEIEAALNHKLPKLVEIKDVKGDLHLHSNWSEGEKSIAEIAKEAELYNYEYIAITDHTAGLGITHGLKENEISKYIKEINHINLKLKNKNSRLDSQARQVKSKVLTGAEVNILANGNLDISDRELSKLDIVIASIHSGFRQDKDKITARLIKAIQNPNVDIIGHPSGRLINKRPPLNLDWDLVFKEAAEHNVIMEINCHPVRLDLNDDLITMAKKYGVKFIINTDMHQFDHFKNMRYGVATARRGWLTKNDVINTYDFAKITNFIKNRNQK